MEAIFCAAVMVLSAGMFYAGYRAAEAEHEAEHEGVILGGGE